MSNTQHGVHVDLASMPNMKANKYHQCLYLDGDMMTWLDVDPCQGEDPSSADLAADWLDALATEAAKLAGWYRSQARHARGSCPAERAATREAMDWAPRAAFPADDDPGSYR